MGQGESRQNSDKNKDKEKKKFEGIFLQQNK